MLEWVAALSPILSAVIGVVSYATLTNYRLDNLDKQVALIHNIEVKLNDLDKRVTILENKKA